MQQISPPSTRYQASALELLITSPSSQVQKQFIITSDQNVLLIRSLVFFDALRGLFWRSEDKNPGIMVNLICAAQALCQMSKFGPAHPRHKCRECTKNVHAPCAIQLSKQSPSAELIYTSDHLLESAKNRMGL